MIMTKGGRVYKRLGGKKEETEPFMNQGEASSDTAADLKREIRAHHVFELMR